MASAVVQARRCKRVPTHTVLVAFAAILAKLEKVAAPCYLHKHWNNRADQPTRTFSQSASSLLSWFSSCQYQLPLQRSGSWTHRLADAHMHNFFEELMFPVCSEHGVQKQLLVCWCACVLPSLAGITYLLGEGGSHTSQTASMAMRQLHAS